MSELSFQFDALGFALAGAIGFLVGRTRREGPEARAPAGIRDFIIISVLGGLAARIQRPELLVVLAAGMSGVLLVARWHRPERTGMTTELAALMTFAVGYLCLTPLRPLGAGLGIGLAAVLTAKAEVHTFALKTISRREFGDTLKFLALIFVIYPLLPHGAYGPFDFFEPRKVWLFVILVSGVSYVGYFLTRFLEPAKGLALSAIVGGLASTTAYTGGVSKAVGESPESAVPLARAAILANTIQLPRLLLLMMFTAPALVGNAVWVLAGMTAAGLLAAWILGRSGGSSQTGRTATGFKNPFSLRPALKFGLVFVAVSFLTRAGRHVFGEGGELVMAAIGGLMDVDAVLFSIGNLFKSGDTTARDALLGVLLAVASNAAFKSALAGVSRQPAFYLRLIAGFAFMLGTGFALLFLIP